MPHPATDAERAKLAKFNIKHLPGLTRFYFDDQMQMDPTGEAWVEHSFWEYRVTNGSDYSEGGPDLVSYKHLDGRFMDLDKLAEVIDNMAGDDEIIATINGKWLDELIEEQEL